MPSSALTVSLAGGGTLDLNDGTTYTLVSFAPQQLDWRRTAVRGRYQAGERLVSAVPDTASITIRLLIQASTWTAVDEAVAAAFVAFQQFDYTVVATFDSVATTYSDCQPATIGHPAGRVLSGEVDECATLLEFIVPCSPNVAVEES